MSRNQLGQTATVALIDFVRKSCVDGSGAKATLSCAEIAKRFERESGHTCTPHNVSSLLESMVVEPMGGGLKTVRDRVADLTSRIGQLEERVVTLEGRAPRRFGDGAADAATP